MTISLRLSREEADLIKNYAQMNGITMSELIRSCVLKHIEDECDLEAFRAAAEAYQADPATLTPDEVERELGLQ